MPAGKKYPVSLTVKAVDAGATRTLAGINREISKLEAPKKLAAAEAKLAGLRSGAPILKDSFSAFGGALKNVGSEAFALGAKLLTMTSLAAVAAYTVVRSWVDAGDKLQELSDRTKTAVDWFASMRYAAEQADVQQDSFNMGMDKFIKNLGDMKANGGSMLSFLDKVSPKLAQQVKGAKSTEAAFSIMTDAFKRIDDPAKLAALGAATFGKAAGPEMANFLHQGSGAIQEQQLKFLKLAGSQSAFAKSSSDLDNDMRDVDTAFTGFRATLGAAFFPVFSRVATAVTAFVVKNRDGLKKWADGAASSIQKWIEGGGLERLASNIGELAENVSSFVDAVGGFKTLAIGAAAVMAGPLLSSFVALVPAVYGLGVALLTTPVGWFLLAVGAIAGAAYLIYKNWEPIKGFFKDTFDGAKGLFSGFLGGVGKFVKGFAETVAGLVTLDFDRVVSGWSTQLDGFKQSLVSFLGLVSALPGGGLILNAAASAGVFGKPLGAAESSASSGGAASSSTEASVSVDFKNVPRGVEVSQERSSQPVNMSLGYANVSY